MLNYPEINPVALHISDTLQIKWYGIMYLLGFALCWLAVRVRTRTQPGWESTEKLNDLLFYVALGVILGGRIGYMLFYALPDLLTDPLQLFKIWQGGMSFHGGLIGVILALMLYARHYRLPFLVVSDLIAPAVPLALCTGRMGNFINGELWGRATDVSWAMIFPHVDQIPRHPSQLYAVLLEGFLLFTLLWCYSKKPRPLGTLSGAFLMGYALIRIAEEYFRQPDPQYGYLAFGWLTMGQLLCLPMLIFGLYLFCLNRVPLCKAT